MNEKSAGTFKSSVRVVAPALILLLFLTGLAWAIGVLLGGMEWIDSVAHRLSIPAFAVLIVPAIVGLLIALLAALLRSMNRE